jgi:hypothetical protein
LTDGVFNQLQWADLPQTRPLGSGGLAGRFDAALKLLERDGVEIPTRCRARNALRFLDHLSPEKIFANRDDVTFQRELAAHHRLAWELFLIVYAADLTRRIDTPFLRVKIAEIIRGADVGEGRDSRARDSQFELATAAQLRLGGVGVYGGEPDLLIDFGNERVGIAAKRVRSPRSDTLDQRVESAVSQIQRSGLRGFIALNIDQRFAEGDLPYDRPEMLRAMHDIFESVSRYRNAHRHPEVLGVMVFGYTTRLITSSDSSEPSHLQVTAPFRFERWVDDESVDAVVFERFTQSWRDRLHGHLDFLVSDGFPRNELPSW